MNTFFHSSSKKKKKWKKKWEKEKCGMKEKDDEWREEDEEVE